MKVAEHKPSSSTAQVQIKTESPFFDTQSTESESPFFAPKGNGDQSASFFAPSTGGFIQTKLTIGQPNDKYEQEADSIADKVVQRLAKPETYTPALSVNNGAVQTKCASCENEEKLQRKEENGEDLPEIQKSTITSTDDYDKVQMKCASCESEESKPIHRKEMSSAPIANQSLESNLNSSKGSGSPLDNQTRSSMESAIGADFSNVHIHTGTNAVQMSQDLNAHAFTHGSDVYFNQGKYNPSSKDGQRLLAHELTHTVQQGVIIRRQVQSSQSASSIDSSINILKEILLNKYPSFVINGFREEIFKAILLQKNNRDELKNSFESTTGVTLEVAIKNGMSGYDEIRALRYLKYGTLRTADKLYFATEGVATDEDTIYRVLPQAHIERIQVETDFINDYSDFHKENGSLPSDRSSKNSRVAGLLEDQMSDWELDKGKALYDFGHLRPIDEVRIATNRKGTDESMIYSALTKGMANPPETNIPSEVTAVLESYGPTTKPARVPLEAAYYISYGRTLSWTLNDELSGDDHLKAKVIIGTKSWLDRLRNAEGTVNDDEDAVYDTVKMASSEEKAEMFTDFQNPHSPMFRILNRFLNSEEMVRIEAMLIVGTSQSENSSPTEGTTESKDFKVTGATAQQHLTAAGATDIEEIFEEIKLSCGDTYIKYKKAWNDKNDPFLAQIKKGNSLFNLSGPLDIITGNSIEDKLRWSDDEDYIFHVITCFVNSDTDRQRISDNVSLMDDIESDLSTSDFNKVLDLLTLTNASPEKMFEQSQARMGRERGWLGDLTNASDAMDDENREWRYALERSKADGQITPEVQIEIEQMRKNTEASIDVYVTARDALEDTVLQVVQTAVAVIAAIATGGISLTATLAMAARQVAVAAIATGLAKVAVTKIIVGDRLDLLSTEVLPVFAGGAVDGVFNVFTAGTASIGKSAVTTTMREVSEQAAREGAKNLEKTAFQQFFSKTAKEGGSAAVSTAVETAADKDTWKKSWLEGFEKIAIQSSISGSMGMGMSAGFQVIGKGYNKLIPGNEPSIKSDQSIELREPPKLKSGIDFEGSEALYTLNGHPIDEATVLTLLRNGELLTLANNKELLLVFNFKNASNEVNQALQDAVAFIEKIKASKQLGDGTPRTSSETDIKVNVSGIAENLETHNVPKTEGPQHSKLLEPSAPKTDVSGVKATTESKALDDTGVFKDSDLEAKFQKYVKRKQAAGKKPRNRLKWKIVSDYWLLDSPMARGNSFNKKAKKAGWYDYHEVHLSNGKRLDSFDFDKGEIISRKATDLKDIDIDTFKSYLDELKGKYRRGTKIRSDKYPELDGKKLWGKYILEIPESNLTFDQIEEYIKIAKKKGVEIRFKPE